MKYQSFLTRKYLLSRFIPWAAVLAVAGGVFALIVVLSVMEGFKVEMRDRIRGTLAHLTVFGHAYTSLYGAEELVAAVEALPHVNAVAPYIEAHGVYKARVLDVCVLRGIDPLAEARVGDLAHYLLRPEELEYLCLQKREIRHLPDDRAPLSEDEITQLFSLEHRRLVAQAAGLQGFELNAPPQPLVVGIELFRAGLVEIGHVIQISSFSPRTEQPRVADFLVVGAFQTGLQEQNMRWMFLPLRASQEFLDLFDERFQDYTFSGLSVQLDDYALASAMTGNVAQAVRSVRDIPMLRVLTWEDQRQTLLDAVDVEKGIITFMMMLIVAFAGMVIFLILTLLVIEKTRDFGILRALGASPGGVVMIVFGLGSLLVFMGLLIGGTGGWAVVSNINLIHDWIYALTGRRLFPPDIYYLTEIPTAFLFWDLFKVIGSACLFGFLGSLIPAFWAARTDPIRALSHE